MNIFDPRVKKNVVSSLYSFHTYSKMSPNVYPRGEKIPEIKKEIKKEENRQKTYGYGISIDQYNFIHPVYPKFKYGDLIKTLTLSGKYIKIPNNSTTNYIIGLTTDIKTKPCEILFQGNGSDLKKNLDLSNINIRENNQLVIYVYLIPKNTSLVSGDDFTFKKLSSSEEKIIADSGYIEIIFEIA